jgi:hypothetical protein
MGADSSDSADGMSSRSLMKSLDISLTALQYWLGGLPLLLEVPTIDSEADVITRDEDDFPGWYAMDPIPGECLGFRRLGRGPWGLKNALGSGSRHRECMMDEIYNRKRA